MTGVLALVVLSIVAVLLILWAILVYLNWKDSRPVVLPVSEKLTAYRAASKSFGIEHTDRTLIEAHRNLLPKYESPYIAVLEDWVGRMSALTSGGGEVHVRPNKGASPPSSGNPPDPEADRIEIERDLKLQYICDFVVEGHVSPDEGRRYYEQLTAMWRKMESRNGLPPTALTGFDAMLEAQRRKSGNLS